MYMMKNNRLRSGLITILSALMCVVIGLAIGFLVLMVLAYVSRNSSGQPFTFADVINDAYTKGFQRVLLGGWYGIGRVPRGPRSQLAQTAPLIMTGLSVAFAFKTGLFNIGAAGQYTVGAFGALLCALVLKLPWYLCLVAAAIFGALWGAIPGFFKAYFNVNEVITAIMFNWIGLYGVNTILYGGGTGVMFNVKASKTWAIAAKSPASLIPDLSGIGSSYFVRPASIGLFIAIAIAFVLWVILNKTTFGYELKACGYSKSAAKYAGINEKKNIILSMAISGALAGIGAGLYYLSDSAQWEPMVSTMLPAFGFDGISVALLASSHPMGIIFSALFISHISTGGGFMDAMIFPPEIADVIAGVIIYLCAFIMLFRNKIGGLFTKKEKGGKK
ncbi:MAG: ABC transporter permease [Clostridia bacterium]|nr:ABC transporter permease [Clostridiales bacterium]MBQ6803082.1 ABC transporter permease [Clostridia bacterium]